MNGHSTTAAALASRPSPRPGTNVRFLADGGIQRRLLLLLVMIWAIVISHSAARPAPGAEPIAKTTTRPQTVARSLPATVATHNIPRNAAPELQVATWVDQTGPTSPPQLRGKVRLVVFWGVHCQPCLRKIPRLQQLASRHSKSDLVIVGLHNAQISPDRLQKFVRERKLNYLVAIDRRAASRYSFGMTTDAYHVQAIPQAAVVDRDGSLNYVGNFDEALASAEALLSGAAEDPGASR